MRDGLAHDETATGIPAAAAKFEGVVNRRL